MMMSTEYDKLSKNGLIGRDEVIRKYEAVVENLQEDLKTCKSRIRLAIIDVAADNENAKKITSDAFHHANNNKYRWNEENRECIENLQGQISVIKLEKDSIFQLWQMALKAIDILEQELKERRKDGQATKYCEDRVHNMKETYSEAIKALETKLLEARDHFEKQQIQWQSTKDKMNQLKSEKTELEQKLINVQTEISYKEKTNRNIMETLRLDLNRTKQELETLNIAKIKLENELMEMRCFTTRIVAKDHESREKVAEAIELVETAVREREIVLHREAVIMDEKTKLENRLANLSDEFVARLDKELCESKDNFERRTENYLTEIKELKSELRDKGMEIDRIQRQCQSIAGELMRARHGTGSYVQDSNSKLLELEEKFKNSQSKLEISEESLQHKFDEKIREYENQILELKDKLAFASDSLRQNLVHNPKKEDDEIKESDYKMRDSAEQCSSFEKCLIRSLDERERVTNELRSLQIIHDREITQRENERRLLEVRIRELQNDIRRANRLADKSIDRADTLEKHINSLEKELEERCSQTMEKKEIECPNAEEILMQSGTIRNRYEMKICELTRYVKVHQKLSAKWKEEAQSLASKFDERYKNLRSKVNILKKENEVLNNELASWRKQIALIHTPAIQRYDQGDSAR